LIFKVRFLPGFFLELVPALRYIFCSAALHKRIPLQSGLSLPRGPSFALPQKKQKGSRHIRFAKNQIRSLKQINSPAAQTEFAS